MDRQGRLFEQVQELENHNNTGLIAFSPNGSILASSYDNMIRIWADRQGRLKRIKELKWSYNIDSVAFSPDGQWLAINSHSNMIQIWADRKGKLKRVQELKGYRSSVDSIAFSPDGRRFASTASGYDDTIRIWELERNVS